VKEIMLLNKFFSDCRYVPQLQRYSPTKLCNGAQVAIFEGSLHLVFSGSRVQHVSDLHRKFALRHTMCGSMADIQSPMAVIRRGKKIER